MSLWGSAVLLSEPFKVCIVVGKTSAPVLTFIKKIPKKNIVRLY